MKNKKIWIRLPEKEKNKAKMMAKIYAEGNLSEWVRHCLREYTPKYIKKGPPKRAIKK